MRFARQFLVVAMASLPTVSLAPGQIHVYIPNMNENTPGASNNAFPFNGGSPMRVQQVFAAGEFAGRSGVVTHIAFRIDESAGNAFNASGIQTEIRLCHTNVQPTQMSTTFADNYGNDVTLVFNGPLSLSSSGSGFDIVIDVDDVFTYDGDRNLLVEYKVRSNANTTQFDSAGTGLGEGGLPSIDRLWAFGADATTGSSNGDDGYVTRITLGAGGLFLRVSGDCPGRVTVSWSNATPSRPMGIALANSTGNFTVPGGVCGGTLLGLSNSGLQLVYTGNTGANGSGSVSSNAGTAACRKFLQMVVADGSPCDTSNVVQIP